MSEIDTLARYAQQKKTALQLRMISKDLRISRVFGKRLLVHLVKPETALDTAERAGLVVVNKEAHTPMASTGIVVMVGNGLTDEVFDDEKNTWIEHTPNDIPQVGAMVMFSKFAGTDIQVEEEQYRIINIDEIICEFEAKAEGMGWEVAP